MFIQHNTNSMNALTSLNVNETALTSSIQKLSSGFRLNRAWFKPMPLLRSEFAMLRPAACSPASPFPAVSSPEFPCRPTAECWRPATIRDRSTSGISAS